MAGTESLVLHVLQRRQQLELRHIMAPLSILFFSPHSGTVCWSIHIMNGLLDCASCLRYSLNLPAIDSIVARTDTIDPIKR